MTEEMFALAANGCWPPSLLAVEICRASGHFFGSFSNRAISEGVENFREILTLLLAFRGAGSFMEVDGTFSVQTDSAVEC